MICFLFSEYCWCACRFCVYRHQDQQPQVPNGKFFLHGHASALKCSRLPSGFKNLWIDNMQRPAVFIEGNYIFCRNNGHLVSGVNGGRTYMWQDTCIFHFQELVVRAHGFRVGHIKACTKYFCGFNCLNEILFIVDRPPCSVDKNCLVFHFSESCFVEYMSCFGCKTAVY